MLGFSVWNLNTFKFPLLVRCHYEFTVAQKRARVIWVKDRESVKRKARVFCGDLNFLIILTHASKIIQFSSFVIVPFSLTLEDKILRLQYISRILLVCWGCLFWKEITLAYMLHFSFCLQTIFSFSKFIISFYLQTSCNFYFIFFFVTIK